MAQSVPAGIVTRREYISVTLACAAASLVAQIWSWQHDAMLNYGDAVAHLHIARRILDSHRPGLTQLGSVWLPLPHLLMLPFVQVYAWWANGIAGAIPSALAYLAGCIGLYRLLRRWLAPAPCALSLAFFALNPNLLYLQTTAMTEPLFLCEMIWIAVLAIEWSSSLDDSHETPASGKPASNRPSLNLAVDQAVLKGHDLNLAVDQVVLKGHDVSRAEISAISTAALAAEGYPSASSLGRLRQSSRQSQRKFWLLIAVLIAAIFTRYDGWIIAFLVWMAVTITLARRDRLNTRAYWIASVLLAAAPAAWFAYNAGFFGDWLYFARGPFSAKAIELRTAAPGWPPHPGWHNPWVSLLFFIKVSELDAAAAAFGNLLLVLSLLGTVLASITERRRAFPWTLLLWIPIPFYAYAVAYGSVPIFIPPWWPHSWYNTRYGMELLPTLAVGLAFAAHFFLAVVREFKPSRAGLRWRAAALAFLAALIGFNFARMLGQHPLVYVEGTKNIAARRPYDLAIPPVLQSLLAARPGGILLMNTSLYPELVSRTGIPLRQTLNESDKQYFKEALADPAGHAAIALAFDGDEVDRAVKAHPQGLTPVRHFAAEGQPAATIYISNDSASSAGRAHGNNSQPVLASG